MGNSEDWAAATTARAWAKDREVEMSSMEGGMEHTRSGKVDYSEPARDSEWMGATHRLDAALEVLSVTADRLGKALAAVLIDEGPDVPPKMTEVDLPHSAAVVRHADGAVESIQRVTNRLERLISRLAV